MGNSFNLNTGDSKKIEKKIYKAGLVDISKLAEAQAKDVADSRMTESKEDRSKNWFLRTGKRIWKHNIAQEWYRQREIGRVKKEISESGNLYAGETKETDLKDYEQAKRAIVERFTSEYEEEMLKTEEKTSKKEITDEETKNKIKDLIKQFAGDPTMSEDAFKEEQKRILSKSHPEYVEKGKMYADNLLDIAREIKNSVSHKEKLAELDFDVEITLGKAKESLNTEAKNNTFEKIIEKTQNSKLGKYLFNEPAGVAIAAGLYSAANFLGVKALRSKVAKWGTFGATALLAGGISASKEAARLNRERAQHIRESAKGMEFKEEDMKRRRQMEENRYETKNASEIIKNLENDLTKISTGTIKEADLDKVLINLSDLEARIKLGDEKKIDLVAYSRFNEVEKERMNLDLSRAKLKVAIRKGIEEGRIEFTKKNTFDEHLQGLINIQSSETLSKDIEQKDKIFKTMKRKKVAATFAKTVLIGGTIGFAFQEVQAAFDSEKDGVLEGVFKKNENLDSKTTALEALRRWITGDAPRLPFGNGHEMILGNTHMQLPENVSINANPDGTYDILRENDVISDNVKLEFTPTEDFTDASKELLIKDDILTNFSQTGEKVTEEIKRTADEYVNKHPELTTKIHREMWMDNDTPMYPDPENPGHLLGADLNELKLEWGGTNGIDANGNYVFTVQHLTDDGSYHNGLSVAAQEQMKEGKLQILLSVTKGLQHEVFKVPIDASGNATIDPHSPIGEMMFQNQNGHAIFNGQFAEIGHQTGIAEDGGENMKILATHIGTGRPGEITEEIIKDTTTPNIEINVPAPSDYKVPPFIPIVPRRPLEKGEYKKLKKEEPDGSRYLYLTGTEQDKARWEKNRSPRLQKNPDAVLSQKEEIDWYFDKQLKERGKDYLIELDSFIEQNEILKNLNENTKIMVCMPVAAAQEYENIYETLSLYSKQDKSAKEKTVILMNVNWPNDADMVKVQKTIDAIKKAKKDFPDLQIADFTKTWERSWIKERKGVIYGEVVKYINDTALKSIQKKNLKNDVYLLTNDADAKGMSKHYLSTLINSTENNKQKDGFLGKIEWSPDLYEKYPGYHLSMRMYQYLETSLRAASTKQKNISSSGANFLVKASTFAAVGGYNEKMGAGADTDLGRSIKNARFGGRETLPEDKYPIKYINGAWIDTDPSRSFRYYKEGRGIVNQWNDFDEGGYQPRGDLALKEDDGEDIEKDFDKIIERSSFQITTLINDWIGFSNKENYTNALNLAFPPKTGKKGEKIELWKVEEDKKTREKWISFTEEGKEWIKKQLKNYKERNSAELIYKRGFRATEKIKGTEEKGKDVVKEAGKESEVNRQKFFKNMGMKELREKLKEAEKDRNEKEVLEIEKAIKELEKKEQGLVPLSPEELTKEVKKNIIPKLLEKIKDKEPEIKSFEIKDDGGKLRIDSVIKVNKTGNRIAPTVTIKLDMLLENKNGEMELGDYSIKAGIATGEVRKLLEPQLPNLIPSIKKYFEEKFAKKIELMKIEDGNLAFEFKK
jgi:hypothetical protein